MADAVLVRSGSTVVFVPGSGAPQRLDLPIEVLEAALSPEGHLSDSASQVARELVSRWPRGCRVASDDPVLLRFFERAGFPMIGTTIPERRAAREKGFVLAGPPDRGFVLASADRATSSALSDPVEALVTLAREEMRLERAVHREQGAVDQFVPGENPSAQAYSKEADRFREHVLAHYRKLLTRVEETAGSVVPNLSRVVGPAVAARLVAVAGGVLPLARMNAARIQLLGSRRRTTVARGPRHGLLVRGQGMDELPASARGAFARSLAALAAVAARADALTHADVASLLVRRREMRIRQLRSQRA